MKISSDFLSVIKRDSGQSFGTGYYGDASNTSYIDDQYNDTNEEQVQDDSASADWLNVIDNIGKGVSAFTNPQPTALAVGTEQLFKERTNETTGDSTSMFEQVLNINTRDALSLNITSRQKELMDSEGKWLPELQEAQAFVQKQKQLLELSKQIQQNPEDTELQSEYQELYSSVLQEESNIKEKAKTNPYLSSVFYGDVKEVVNAMLPPRKIEASTVRNQLAEGRLSPYYADMSWKQNNVDITKSNPATLSLLDIKSSNLSKQLEDAQQEFERKSNDLKEKQQSLKTAHWLHDPLVGVIPMPLYYNPEVIDPVLDKKRSEVEIQALDPSSWQYGLYHLGSSASELQGMGIQMLTALGVKYGAKLGGPWAWAAGEAVVNSLFTQYFRHKETAGEVMSNYVEKLANAAQQDKFDLGAVLSDYDQQLQSMGYDVSKMDEMERLQFGLAYNIPTSDENYNAFAKDARKGLTQIEETNNALALGDYAENLGLSYGGKLLNKSIGFGAIMKGAASLVNKNKTTAALLQKLGSKIDRAAVKLMKDPITRMKAKHLREKGTDLALGFGKRWFFESTEEGQQNLIGDWYQNLPEGATNVPDTYNIFRGVETAGRLALEANLAYRGMHWNDKYNTDEQLKIEMGIGGFIGGFMGGASSISQLNDIRKQLKADNTVRALAAKGFENAENNFKIAQFLDYARKGRSISHLQTSLEDFKKYKTEGVTDEMIDDDIRIARDVNSIYNNKLIKPNLKELGINRKKDKEFEQFVQNTISLYDRQKDASKSQQDSESRLDLLTNEAITNDDSNEFNIFLEANYNEYLKGRENPLSKKEFKKIFVDAVKAKAFTNVLKNLKKDLKTRKKTFEQLKEQYGLSIDTTGVEGMLKYIEDSLANVQEKNSKIIEEQKLAKFLFDNAPTLFNQGEIEKEMAINILNSGVNASLNAQMQAYTTGRLNTNHRYLVESKPIYSNLSEEQKKKVITKYSEEYKKEKGTDKEPTTKQVITYYNNKVLKEWADLEASANVEQSERFLANSLILQNLRKDAEEQEQARKELEEETGHTAAQTDGEGTTEQESNNIEQSEQQDTTEAPEQIQTKQEDIERDKLDTEDESLVQDEVSTVTRDTTTPIDQINTPNEPTKLDSIEIQSPDSVDDALQMLSEQDPDTVLQQDEAVDNILPEDKVDDSNTPVESSINDSIDDTTAQEDAIRAKLEQVEDGLPLATEEGAELDQDYSVQDIEGTTTPEQYQQPTIEDQEKESMKPDSIVIDDSSKTEETKISTAKPEGQKEVKIEVESFDGSDAKEVSIVIEEPANMVYSDGEQVWVGDPDPQLGTHIEDSQLELQNQMEMIDVVDMATTSRSQQALGQSDKSPGLDTKKKVETNRIHSTFFYAFESEEIMPIKVGDKDVKFDGQRRPGKELSKKLAIPGWLEKQTCYYIITDSKQTRKGEKDAADRLAIHLIIEEEVDGKKYIYNTALYTPDKARTKVRNWGVSVEKQNEEVRKLRDLRREIISKYVGRYAPSYFSDPKVGLPITAQKGIVPVGLRQSNGSINSQEDGPNPIYRPLTAVEQFGLSSDPYEMSSQLLNGEVEFGYGKGPFPLDPVDAFSIVQFDGQTRTSAQGIGYAGKIYIIPKTSQTPSQRVSAPIMLAEKRHFIPGGLQGFSTSYDPSGNAKHHNGKRVPLTSAELVFRLVTGTLPVSGRPVYKDILDILCNHGPSTITIGDYRVEKLSFYVRKTLHTFQDEKGNTILMYGSMSDSGAHVTKYLKVKDASGKYIFTEPQAYQVIQDISKNIHWNTDKEAMMKPISDNIVNEAIRYMNQYKTDYYKVLNCDDLVFTMEDLGLTRNESGEVVRIKEQAPLLMSWMINHQILKTSVGEQAFRDPFVYADGAQEVGDPTPVTPEPTGPVTTETPRVETSEVIEAIQEEKNAATEPQTATEEPVSPSKPSNKDRVLSKEEVIAMGLTPKFKWEYILKQDGTTVMLPSSSPIVAKLRGQQKGVTSVFRGEGKVDQDAAKEWLHSTLGIDPDNVMATSAVMKMANAPQVFGVMQVVFDRILKEFRPQITLSDQSGRGIEYHEGFHYVSLLILNEQQRNQVYSDYVKNNPQHEGKTKQEVEELLAEEFRAYMLKLENPSLTYHIKKFFKALWNLVTSFGNKPVNMQSELFQAIRKGNFKNATLSQESLKEFATAYQAGVYYYAPGISSAEQKATPHITNASTMYNIIESLSSTALATLNIRSMEDIKNLKLAGVFDTIQYNYDAGLYDDNLTNKQIVEDVLKNKEIFAKQIKSFLQELGIKSIEREETEIQIKEEQDRGDSYDNTWDRASYEISKKANVAFNAKLFFYSMPKSRFVLTEEGNVLDTVKDPIFGMDVVHPFDITWNKILDNLWASNDWEDLLSKVRRLSKADPFFATLREYIDNPEFPLAENTVTQLLTTIQSAKNSMDTIVIDSGSEINKATGKRTWEVQDSDNLRKIAMLPSQWSQNFVLSSMVTTDNKNRSIINTKALQNSTIIINQISNNIDKLSKGKVSQDKLTLFQDTKNLFLDLVNGYGIPFDMEALDYLLRSISTRESNGIVGLDAFNLIFQTNQTKSDRGVVVNSIKNSVHANIKAMAANSSLEAKFRGATVSADRIFNYRDPNSVINLMAIAYAETHPTSEELSVSGADGSLVFPITQNNYMSDQLRWLNTNSYGKLQNLSNTPYCKNSLIVKALLGKNKPKLKLHTLIAVNDAVTDTSRDYFGISPLEDYITKMVLAENDRLILPTMSDKKTWYSIEGIQTPKDFISSVMFLPDEDGIMQEVLPDRYFSNDTLDIFCNYFIDEFNAITEYYNTKSDVEKGKSRYYSNYHGKIGKDGKMKPGGNGGRFRYFNQLTLPNGEVISLNSLLATAEESGDPKLIKETLDNINKILIQDMDTLRMSFDRLLMQKVEKEIQEAINIGVITRDEEGNLHPTNIPVNIFKKYKEMSESQDENVATNEAVTSIIANYVTSYAISIEELEKCFVGDPAFYKWKSSKEVGIFQRDVDKIKRLSSVLSTGTNLRTYWGANDPRNDTRFTSMVMQDNMIGSDYHDSLKTIFRQSFIRTMLSKENPDLTDEQLFNAVKNETKMQEAYNSLSESSKKFVDRQTEKAASPYAYDDENNSGNINQADAAVYIRPAMYKRIMQALGEWSAEVEEAYNILESEDDVLSNPEKYEKALRASIKPLKMMYFGDNYDALAKINVPTFDKMALFPMFKILAKADNKYLYDRMNNEELGTIDMLAFESAVKVGAPADKFKAYKDNRNTSFNIEDLNKPSTISIKNGNVVEQLDGLTTRIQDIKQLRLQLNTDPHEHLDRSFGTQAIKIGIGNVVDDRYYGHNKGQNVSGAQIKKDIFGCIKALSTLGYNNLKGGTLNGIKKGGKFFKKDGRVNNVALSEYLIREATGTNMSQEVIDSLKLDKNGNFRAPIASLSVRNWIESKIISLINKEVIDVNTPGGSAIQMASFGFKSNDVITDGSEDARPFNDGKKLSFEPKKGSMEVMLSTNFFRGVVPNEVQQQGYTAIRKWLLDNNVIGSNAKPYGVGYRIPTQGLSSTFSFIVADVIPAQTGDSIIVPDEFTAMTGSDFDIDKLYIATYSYDKKTGLRHEWNPDAKYYTDQTKGALINKMLDSYTLVISDEKTLAETRASIDTLTGILTKEILPKVSVDELKEAESMYELMPSFQEYRKMEYTWGKAGIAPFALNSTNHCLTQATHLNMNYSNNNIYGLGKLDAIDGQDGFKILDWLSAMINAHVDVAKDPYIIKLNVNNVTYNMTNLLLRGGKGETTFFFLAQPILKEFANIKIANNGVVGAKEEFDNQIINRLIQKYQDMLDNFPLSKQGKMSLQDVTEEDALLAFDKQRLSQSLEAFRKGEPSPQDIKMQLIVLKAYNQLSKDAQVLSDLVQRSQIDTKKYGNNLTQLQNFNNSYTTFIEDNKEKFTTPTQTEEISGLEDYFGKTFLNKKLIYALDLSNSILKTQVFGATNGYKSIFTGVMHNLRGGDYAIQKSDTLTLYQYKATSNKQLVKKINDRVESIIRAKVVMNDTNLKLSDEEIRTLVYGQQNIAKQLNSIKNYIRKNLTDPNLVTLVNADGTISNDVLNYLQGITISKKNKLNKITTVTSSMNNSRYFEDRLRSAFYDLLTNDDPVVKEFAERLVKYAFLTSYDNRTPNSFFNIVPMDYKEQIGYVNSIKVAMRKLITNDADLLSDSTTQQDLIDSVSLNLVRNYWADGDIVPVYTPKVYIKAGEESKSNTAYLSSTTDKMNTNVQTAFVALGQGDISKRPKFVKIIGQNGRGTTLYQRAGIISAMENQSDKTLGVVYVAIPKLGVGNGSSSIYELYKNGNEQSAFDVNVFTKTMLDQTSEDGLKESVDKYISRINGYELVEFVRDETYQTIDTPKENYSIEQELQNELVESFGDSGISEDLNSIDSDPSAEFIDMSDNSLTIEDSTLVDEIIGDMSDLSESYGDELLDFDNDLSFDSMEVIDSVIGGLESSESNISEVNEHLTNLKEEGKKRKKQCKK